MGDTISRFHVANSPIGEVLGFKDYSDNNKAFQVSQKVRQLLQAQGFGKTLHFWIQEIAGFYSQRDKGRLNQLLELAYT